MIYAAHSPAQAPFIPALVTESTWLDDSQLVILVAAVAASLEQTERDDLSFRVYFSDLEHNVFLLADRCAERKISNAPLIAALRTQIVKQLSGDRCQRETTLMDASRYIASFRSLAEVLFPPNADLKPVSQDDLKPASVQPPPDSDETYFRSSRSSRLQASFKALRDERQSASYNESDWRQHLAVFRSAMQNWNPTEEPSERTYFHEKSVLYRSLQSLNLPPVEERGVLEDYFGFLEDQRFRDLGVEWFLYAKDLLSALDKAGLKDQLLKDPVLALYSRLAADGLYQN